MPATELPLTFSNGDRPRPNAADEAEIARLVEAFYVEAREDPVLGPVFERRVSDWEAHLSTMRDFWGAAVYHTGRYSGRPLEVHRAIAEIGPGHFDRWVSLWERVVDREVASDARVLLKLYARRMAASMSGRLHAGRGGAP